MVTDYTTVSHLTLMLCEANQWWQYVCISGCAIPVTQYTIITVQLIFWSNLGHSQCWASPGPVSLLLHHTTLLSLTFFVASLSSQLSAQNITLSARCGTSQTSTIWAPFIWKDKAKLSVYNMYLNVSVEMTAVSPDTVTSQVSSTGLSRFTFLILKCLNRLRYFGWPTEVDLYYRKYDKT